MIRFWHKEEKKRIFDELGTSDNGLDVAIAARRLQEEGPNALPESKVDGIAEIFLRQFESPLIYVLLGASGLVLYMGETTDAIIIMSVLVFNAIVGAIQEGRAQNTLLALKTYVSTNATVVREGREMVIPDSEIVRGDIVILDEGEKVPADARVLDVRGLKIDESSLTGESEPLSKMVEAIDAESIPPAEQRNMVFKGTTVVSGNGRVVVVGTGSNTAIGGIAEKIASVNTEMPLKASIRALSRAIIVVVAGISVLLFALGIYAGHDIVTIFGTVVSLAVSVIPEGLPIVITLVLATGVWRMSKRNALIKKLQAVEALGQASVIAVDKTGTITKNELVIRSAWFGGEFYDVDGVGYEPKGDVRQGGESISPANHGDLLFGGKLAAFCASAHVSYSEAEQRWRVTGDPTEAALRVFGEKVGFQKDELLRECPFVSEIPFDYRLKFHATAHAIDGKNFLAVLGAPESVLERCTHVRVGGEVHPLTPEMLTVLEEAVAQMSDRGLRIIAAGYADDVPVPLDVDAVAGLTFAGFYGMQDVLRPEVEDAMRRARDAGIRVVMITGDHKITARAIAREAGIWRKGEYVLTGEDLAHMSELELKEKLPSVSVFARVTPEDKMRIVTAFKERGDTIAMTGDGVNDAPPLVAADLGVAMGRIGTEVAKEAADIVLLDDNFGSIVSAVEEGRSIYRTIRKVILYLFSTSLGEVLTITGALLVGLPLPLLASQIIWLNFVTDGFLTVALAMEPKDSDLLKRSFKRPNRYLIDKAMALRMLPMAVVMSVGTLLLFSGLYGATGEKALTISLTVLAIYQWFNAWNCRSDTKSIVNGHSLGNVYLAGATAIVVFLQLLAVYNPVLQRILHTSPLSALDWIVVLSVASTIVIVEELRKLFVRRTA